MFKIKNMELLQGPMHQALTRLTNEKGETVAVFNLMRLNRQVGKAMKEAGELYNKITQDMFVTDENGKFVPHVTPTPLCPHQIKEGLEAEFQKKMEDFLAIEVEIQSYPINLTDFPGYQPSARELEWLQPMLAPEDPQAPPA